jgi:hypothetical protein
MSRLTTACLCTLGLVLLAAPARAEKMAVLVLGTSEQDAELADNVTEMIIAHVARRGGFELAGKEELRGRLGVETERKAQACLDDVACLGRAAVSLGVRRIVSGHVGTRGRQFLFSLTLNDVEAGRIDNRVFRLVEGRVDDLIAAVRSGTEELFRPKVEPGRIQVSSEPEGARVSIDNAYLGVTPLISGSLLPGVHKVRVEADGRFPWVSRVEVHPGQDLGIKLTGRNLPQRRRWPAIAAAGTGGLALASFAAGGFLGALSQLTPSGDTRAEAQRDLRQKERLARGATGALIAGGALSAASALLLVIYRDDVFGRGEAAEPR